MGFRTRLFGALGTVATVTAAVVLFAPESVLARVPIDPLVTAAETFDTRQVLIGGSALVGLYLIVAGRSAMRAPRDGSGRDAFDDATEEPPEAVTAARQRQTAEDLDEQFEGAVAGEYGQFQAVRDRLREAVVAAYAQTAGCDLETAEEAVDRGEWTDDRTAAAVLAGEDGPDYSLLSRLYLWLDPESERRRRLDRAVSEARGLTEGWR